MKLKDKDMIQFNKCDITTPITLEDFKEGTGLSTEQVKKAIKELKEKGLIVELNNSKNGTVYFINYDIKGLKNGKI